MKYCFYYDESEHSRVINLSTVIGETYYDGFMAAIIGWRNDHEAAFEQRYCAFEEKYADRKKKGELKSGTIKPKQLVHGFASLNKANVKLLGDFFSTFDENSYIYLFCASKIEYVIIQIFKGYRNSVFFDMDAARYSIVKAIVTYRPTEVIESLYKSPAEFVAALKTFLTNRIRRNKENLELKTQENTAFRDLSKNLGADRVIWRYDPILLTEKYTVDYHVTYFEEIAKRLSGYTNKCIISFVDMYRNTQGNMKAFGLLPLGTKEMLELAQRLVAIAEKYHIIVESCAEKINLEQFGIAHGHCIDCGLFEKLLGCKLNLDKDKNQREECGCMASIDIGMYNTCRNGCRYCYANYSAKTVERLCSLHDPLSPLISGIVGPDDVVKERLVRSCKQCQMDLF